METYSDKSHVGGLSVHLKYLLYLLILCLAGWTVCETNLHQMIEGRGLIGKLLFSVPKQLWIIGATAIEVFFLIKTRLRTSSVYPAVSSLWISLISLTAFIGCIGLIDSGHEIISILQIIAELGIIVIMISLGIKFCVFDEKPIAYLGKALIWCPILLMLAIIAFWTLLPDDYGDLQQNIYNDISGWQIITEKYTDSTIIYTLIFCAIIVVCESIVYGVMGLVISMPDYEEMSVKMEPELLDKDTSDEVSELENVTSSELDEHEKSKRFSIIKIALITGFALIFAAGAYHLLKDTSVKIDDESFLNHLTEYESGEYYINIEDCESNLILYRPDSLSNNIEIELAINEHLIEGNWIGVIQDGFINPCDNSGSKYSQLQIVSLYHLVDKTTGNNFYSLSYLEQEAREAPVEIFEDTEGFGNLEVQQFTVDGHKFAKTNYFGMLAVDDNNVAETCNDFSVDYDGEKISIKFEDEILVYRNNGQDNVYKKNTQSEASTEGVSVIVGHSYSNTDYGIEWTFINDNEGRSNGTKFRWGKGEPGHILIYGDNGKIEAGAKILKNGKALSVLDFSDGSEIILKRIR